MVMILMIVNRLWQTMPQRTIRRSCMPLYLIFLMYLFLLPIGGPGSFSDLVLVKDKFGHDKSISTINIVLYFFVSCRLSLLGLALCIILQILNEWMNICFYTTDVTHLKPYVEDRRWMELNNAIDVMMFEAARQHSDGGTGLIANSTSTTSTATHRNSYNSITTTTSSSNTGTLKLPVSFLIRVLEQGAPYYIIKKVLLATPGLASQSEDSGTSITSGDIMHDIMILLKQRPSREKRYPIHVACEATASNNNNETPQIIRALIQDYPNGVREAYGGFNGRNRLPIHIIVKSVARDYNEDATISSDGNNSNNSTTTQENDMLDVIKMLITLYPKGLEHCDQNDELPLHIVINKMFYYGTHPYDKSNHYCFKISHVLLEVALVMLRVYPQAAARCRFTTHRRDEPSECLLHEAIRNMVVISYELKNELSLLKALVEAYPKAAVTQKGSRTSIFHTYILHTFCSIERTDETPSLPITYSKYYVDAFYSIFNAYPEAAKHKNNSGHLPIHIISSRRVIPLFILRTLVQAYPQSLYEGVNVNLCYSTNHKDQPPLFTYFFNKLATLYSSIDSHNNNSSNNKNASSAIKKKNFLEKSGWKDVITYIVHATYKYDTKNHTSRNNNNNNNGLLLEGGQSIPTLHGSIYYRAPYDAIKQIICWYPSSVTEVDQFNMLPIHYACLPPSPTSSTVRKSSNSSSANVSMVSVTVDGSTTSSPIKKNNKKENDGTSTATLEQVNIILLLLLHNPNVLQGLL